ncbi:MAG: hypothetical protein AAB428_01500 [Patescibacteria group bacterium]
MIINQTIHTYPLISGLIAASEERVETAEFTQHPSEVATKGIAPFITALTAKASRFNMKKITSRTIIPILAFVLIFGYGAPIVALATDTQNDCSGLCWGLVYSQSGTLPPPPTFTMNPITSNWNQTYTQGGTLPAAPIFTMGPITSNWNQTYTQGGTLPPAPTFTMGPITSNWNQTYTQGGTLPLAPGFNMSQMSSGWGNMTYGTTGNLAVNTNLYAQGGAIGVNTSPAQVSNLGVNTNPQTQVSNLGVNTNAQVETSSLGVNTGSQTQTSNLGVNTGSINGVGVTTR